MSYFADLTLHTYVRDGTEGQTVLNVGWLDQSCEFPRGAVPPDFIEALLDLCHRPVHLHRGFHQCQFCPSDGALFSSIGNGQIRIMSRDGIWYAAPRMVHHYVVAHQYRPPQVFIDVVLAPSAIACRTLITRPSAGYPAKTNPPK
jgi:hypothetical protein